MNTAQTKDSEIFEHLENGGVTDAEHRNLLAFLSSQRWGVPHKLTRHTLERARALAKRYELHGELLGASTSTRRLDFDLGREVVDEPASPPDLETTSHGCELSTYACWPAARRVGRHMGWQRSAVEA